MRHGEHVAPSPWVEILKIFEDRPMWEGLSMSIEDYLDRHSCRCEVYCECEED